MTNTNLSPDSIIISKDFHRGKNLIVKERGLLEDIFRQISANSTGHQGGDCNLELCNDFGLAIFADNGHSLSWLKVRTVVGNSTTVYLCVVFCARRTVVR